MMFVIAAIPFACVRAESISIRGIEFTPDVQACLHHLGFGHLVEQTIYNVPVEKGATSGDRVEQPLYLIHATTAGIELPPLALKRNLALSGVLCRVRADVFDCPFLSRVGSA